MKKIVISFIGFIVFIGSVLLINYNTPNIDLKIYATKDSFANNYANKYHLEFEEVAESEKNNYFISLENFEYKQVDGGIELNKYLGISNYLIIPNKIDGQNVISINKKLYENKNIKTIVLPSSITNIDDTTLKIECVNSKYCESLVNDNKATMLNDSNEIDFNNYNNIVEYNIIDNKAEVVKSFNIDGATIIPKTINGYEVNKINIDTENIKKVYIPDSVSIINMKNVSNSFIYTIIGLVIAYVLYLITVLNVSTKDLNNMTKNTIIYIISIIYILFVGYLSINYNSSYYIVLIISSLCYIFLSLVLKIYKKQNIGYEEKISNSGSFIKECLIILEKTDRDNKYNLKDKLKYSDPISINEVEEIENEIKSCLNNLNEDSVKKIEDLIKERNTIIKNMKN